MAFNPTKEATIASILTLLPDNTSRQITPADVRDALEKALIYAENAEDADNIAEGSTNKFMTVAERSKLAGIAAGAQVNPALISQGEAEAGTATTVRGWSALRVAQAIAALAPSGGGGGGLTLDPSVKTASFAAALNTHHLLDTSGGSIQVTIPAVGTVSVGDEIGFSDARGTLAPTNFCRLNIGASGARYKGLTSQSPQLEKADNGIVLVYQGASYGWVIKTGLFG